MKQPLPLIAFFFCTYSIAAQSENYPKVWFGGGDVCTDAPWQLVFSDDFDGDSLNRDKWMTWYPYGENSSDQCSFCRTHGDEGQIYRDENIEVKNGVLRLIAKKEAGTWYDLPRAYSSGMVHSRQSFTDYARYEIRCKIPSGEGFWPAFWVFGWSTEIDVFEFGTGAPDRLYTGFFKNLSGGKNLHMSYDYSGPDLSDGFHTIAAQYEPFFIHLEVDSVRVHTFSRYYTLDGSPVAACRIPEGPYLQNPVFPRFGDPVQVIANLAVGAENTPFTGPPPPETPMPNQMEIDFIKVYQLASPGQHALPTQNLVIHPNPATDNVQVNLEAFDVPALAAEGALIDLLDLRYQVIRSTPVNGAGVTLPVETLSPGFYLLRLRTAGAVYLAKLIKI